MTTANAARILGPSGLWRTAIVSDVKELVDRGAYDKNVKLGLRSTNFRVKTLVTWSQVAENLTRIA